MTGMQYILAKWWPEYCAEGGDLLGRATPSLGGLQLRQLQNERGRTSALAAEDALQRRQHVGDAEHCLRREPGES
jgi:hypothetical protein